MIKLIQIYILEMFVNMKSQSLRRPRIPPPPLMHFPAAHPLFFNDLFILEY
jgi:hypothetical protein